MPLRLALITHTRNETNARQKQHQNHTLHLNENTDFSIIIISFEPELKKPETYLDLIDGWVLLVDKPITWTSFDVVNKLKGHLKGLKKVQPEEWRDRNVKIGHAGTLDPLATGLLVVCVGKKTKELDQLQTGIKTYTGTIHMGQTTPSYDLETTPTGNFEFENLTIDDYQKVAQSFLGEQWQTPPVFSAKQINGKRAYEFAREGIDVEMKKSWIEIFDFQITRCQPPEIDFEITCSKGTYIRTIAHEFGQRLNSGSYLQNLRRTKSLPFDVKDAISVDEWCDFFWKWKNLEK